MGFQVFSLSPYCANGETEVQGAYGHGSPGPAAPDSLAQVQAALAPGDTSLMYGVMYLSPFLFFNIITVLC